MIDRDVSLLIWDYLFIEGNKVYKPERQDNK